ncbi:unnamed protein product [Clonostachys rosea]|uniref:Uncharacterized protein n=1 Tax=Bionectria ochroleuca TaxID=29856 RepID=A0ABY6URB0_BIOOC|nr:unnamed protein product [Clonostachys rosea]
MRITNIACLLLLQLVGGVLAAGTVEHKEHADGSYSWSKVHKGVFKPEDSAFEADVNNEYQHMKADAKAKGMSDAQTPSAMSGAWYPHDQDKNAVGRQKGDLVYHSSIKWP